MIRNAVYPGSFDPVTLGHLDLIERGARLFGHLTVAVAENPTKQPYFSTQERVEMLEMVTKQIENVEIKTFDGLMVDFARSIGAQVVLRGMRAILDFEYELDMALTNRRLAPDIETVFLMPSLHYTYLRASIVKNVANLGGDLSAFVPQPVAERLMNRCKRKNGGN